MPSHVQVILTKCGPHGGGVRLVVAALLGAAGRGDVIGRQLPQKGGQAHLEQFLQRVPDLQARLRTHLPQHSAPRVLIVGYANL